MGCLPFTGAEGRDSQRVDDFGGAFAMLVELALGVGVTARVNRALGQRMPLNRPGLQ